MFERGYPLDTNQPKLLLKIYYKQKLLKTHVIMMAITYNVNKQADRRSHEMCVFKTWRSRQAADHLTLM